MGHANQVDEDVGLARGRGNGVGAEGVAGDGERARRNAVLGAGAKKHADAAVAGEETWGELLAEVAGAAGEEDVEQSMEVREWVDGWISAGRDLVCCAVNSGWMMLETSDLRTEALLRDGSQPSRTPVIETGGSAMEKSAGPRIRCPHCLWQPGSGSRWWCGSVEAPEFYRGCGTAWNTFDTRGVCPGCSHQWRHTSCLRCGQWSLHEDWYDRADED